MIRTHLSLFSGIGLGDLGCEWAGVQTVGQVEIDPWNQRVLEHHWPGLWRRGDITQVSDDDFSRFSGVWCISGGFPCQDISVAGKGEGIDGERSGLWTHMRRAISVCRPRWALIENVPALRTRGADRVLADMEGLGYTCWPLVVGAWAVGAPHRRNRVWIVGRNMGHTVSQGAGDRLREDRGQGRQHTNASESTAIRQAHGADGAGRADSTGEDGSGPAHSPRGGFGADGGSLGRAGHAYIGGKVLPDTIGDGRGTRTGEQGNEGSAGIGRRELARSSGMEHTTLTRLEGGREGLHTAGCESAVEHTNGAGLRAGGRHGQAVTHQTGAGICWPTGPGQPQHAWECPRLLANNNGRPRDGKRDQRDGGDQRGGGDTGTEQELPRLIESGMGGAVDDRAGRRELAGWRKAALKGLGNAQVPHVVAAVVRSMVAVDAG